MAVVRIAAQLRIIDCAPPLSKFVRLDRGAEGEGGWVGRAGALLIEAREPGRVLVGAFAGECPPQFQGLCVHDASGLEPELIIASVCLHEGIVTTGCGLYTRQFPSLKHASFFERAGINRFFYAAGERDGIVVSFLIHKGVSINRVIA